MQQGRFRASGMVTHHHHTPSTLLSLILDYRTGGSFLASRRGSLFPSAEAPALIPWLKPYRLRPWFAGLKPSPSTGSFALTHGTPGWEPRALIARCFARWYKLARTEPRSGGGALRPGRKPRGDG